MKIARKIKIVCKKKKIHLNLSNSIGRLLGFSKRVIRKDTTVYSHIMVDIFPVNAI